MTAWRILRHHHRSKPINNADLLYIDSCHCAPLRQQPPIWKRCRRVDLGGSTRRRQIDRLFRTVVQSESVVGCFPLCWLAPIGNIGSAYQSSKATFAGPPSAEPMRCDGWLFICNLVYRNVLLCCRPVGVIKPFCVSNSIIAEFLMEEIPDSHPQNEIDCASV